MAVQDGPCYAHPGVSPQAGTGLFASKPILPGQLILSIDRPLLAVPDIAHLSSTCSSCFVWIPENSDGAEQNSPCLKHCAGCKVVKYCGKKCQSQSWKAEHKLECKLYARLYPKILPATVRATIRLLLLSKNKAIADVQWSSLLDLMSHVEDFRQQGGDRWERICMMSKGAEMYSGTGHGQVFVLELYCRVLINSLTLVTPVFDPLGISFDTLAASVNHSCDPNAVVVFDGPCLSFRALGKIAKEEEITISYVDCTNPYQQRQQELSERYFFTCACSKCQNGRALREDSFLRDVLDLEELRAAESKAFKLLENAKSLEPVLAEKALLQAAQVITDHKAVWPRDHQPWPSVRQQLTVNLISRGLWVIALAHMLKTYFYVDPVLFPQPFHPVRVVHNWTLIRIVLFVSSLSASDPGLVSELDKHELDYGTIVWALAMEVESNIDASHGRGSTLALTVRRKVEEVRVDMTRQGTGKLATVKNRLDKEWAKLRALADQLVD